MANMKEAPAAVYDMLRNKARDMGHAAADLPDALWDKYSRMVYKHDVLKDSKLIITEYMMGRLSPAELAETMAENDALRYTVSDICRMRLEPADIDIQHNGKYIDLAAGAKTFWSEMKVPIPSEIDAARDLRNIYYGIEAGKASAGQKVMEMEASEEETVQEKEPRRSIREVIRDMKQAAARKGVEILTPIANGESEEAKELKESGLSPEQVIEAYQKQVVDQRTKEIENITMSAEASRDKALAEAERISALKSAGVSEEKAGEIAKKPQAPDNLKSNFTPEELNSNMDDQIAEILDQIQKHASRDLRDQKVQKPAAETTKETGKEKRLRKGYVSGQFEGEEVRFKGSWSTHKFSDEEVQKLLAGETISFAYESKSGDEKTVYGKLEHQTHEGREFFGFKANFADKAVETSKGDDSLFNAWDEALAMGDPPPEEEGLPPAMTAERLEQLFSESSEKADDVTLTSEDVSAIDDGGLCFSK